MNMIVNEGSIASGKIYNVGNPTNSSSIRTLAATMLGIAASHPVFAKASTMVKMVEVKGEEYYGDGYQDIQGRTPSIAQTCTDLGWSPRVSLVEALQRILSDQS